VPSSRPARPAPRPVRLRRLRIAALLAAAAVAATLGSQLLASSSSTTSWTSTAASAVRVVLRGEPGARLRGTLGQADGAVPDGTTVFDDGVPGVARLRPALRTALRRAAADAGADGVTFVVDSGWRSAAYQERLLQQAVAKYGSEAEAARWVATPTTSAHVSGDAVDLGPAAAAWLAQHGAAYGLCRVYANESWHFELRPEAAGRGCPPMAADAAHATTGR
jgi:hypothetical protein